MGKNLRVLLVDDDELILMSFGDMLRDMGHEVVEVTSAPEALARLQENPLLDVMISDVNLPGMDGCALVSRVRELRSDLPVVYSSGYSPERLAHLPPDPMIRFLHKPFASADVEAVFDSIRHYFKPTLLSA